MATRKVEDEIERLIGLRDGSPENALAPLRKALGDRVNLVAAKAAKLAGEMHLADLVPDLLRAFDRLMEKAAERDPQCWGKNAIATALKDLDHRESAVFLRGMRHVQMEAVWGGQEDTAPTLRGICLLALPSCTDVTRAEVLRALVDAVAEKEHVVRAEAVRALAQMEGEESMLLLRLKARTGDAEPSVIGQVFDSILRLEREGGLRFVADFLQATEEDVRQEAAMALGASRLPEATGLLRDAWTQTRDSRFRESLLRALSASRRPDAIEFLLSMVKDRREHEAAAALEALAIHRDSGEIRRQVEEAVKRRGALLETQFQQAFGGN
jgi:HEAT repeat protein